MVKNTWFFFWNDYTVYSKIYFYIFNMDIEYETNSLRKLAESHDKLLSKFKDERIVQWILSRIRHFDLSDNLLEFTINQPNCRIHPLTWSMKWSVAIDAVNKTCPIRIVFINTNWEDITQDMLNKEKRGTVTAIKIISIWDYH